MMMPQPASAKVESGACVGLSGAAGGLCKAYCEAQQCHVDGRPSCERLRKNFARHTGSADFPCDTPGEERCVAGQTVTVEFAIDTPYGGASIALDYPPNVVDIPGSADDASVSERVTFIPSGFTVVNDQDSDFDGTDDRLRAVFANIEQLTPAGPFMLVEFDCIEGSPVPDVGSFSCSVLSLSDELGNTIEGGCTLLIP